MTQPDLEPVHPDAPAVVLYTKPGCGPCMASAKAMAKRGIDFTKLDITADDNAAARVRELGYMSVPVIVAGDMHWSGFQLTKISQLAHALRGWTPSTAVVEGDHDDAA